MLFNSIEFLIFFPVVTLLYFLLPHRFRWLHLLVASSVFYMFFIPAYILILAFTIVIDYFAGILIENSPGKRRKSFLVMSLAANIGVLAVFKYYNFLNDNLAQVTHMFHLDYALPTLSILLPVGLSFHTFQAMSYTIEVYRGKQKAERHFGIYALYVMFYPQLVAGPIERPQNLIHQFYERHTFDSQRVSDGLKLMLWGFFKKIVVADRLAVFVDSVYNQPREWDGVTIIIATAFFAYQIYCDFSGYSDIAIGAAQVMGFKLMTNFNRPFHSRSISEFWKRWHISLSTWLRDYIYVPLSRAYGSRGMRHFNLFLTFVVAGIWHGANWTFVMYGAINGIYIFCSSRTADMRRKFVKSIGLTSYPRFHHILKILITFGLASYAGVFFRAKSMSDALYIHRAAGSIFIHPAQALAVNLPSSFSQFILCLSVIAFLEFVETTQGNQSIQEFFGSKPLWLRWTIYYGLVLAIFLFGEFNDRQFIYFQF